MTLIKRIKPKTIILILILLCAIALRVPGMKWGLPDKEHFYPYYTDEYNVIEVLNNMTPEKMDFNPHYFHNPTLFYYLVGISIKLLSYTGIVTLTQSKNYFLLNPGEYAKLYLVGRSISLILGILTIFLVYLIGEKLYDERVGLLSAFILSIVPLHVVHSHYAELAVPVTFMITLALFFCVNILKSGDTRWYIISGMAAGFAIGTKYTAAPVLVVITVAHFLREKKINKKIILAYITCVISFIVCNPYSIIAFNEFAEGVLYSFNRASNAWSVLGHGFLFPITSLLYYGMGFPLLVVAIGGVVLAMLKRKKCDILLLSWVLVYYIITAKSGSDMARYQTEQLPFLVVLSARFMFYDYKIFKKHISDKVKKKLRLAGIIIIGVCTLIYSMAHINLTQEKTPQDRASSWIKNNLNKDTKIGIAREPYFYSPPVINMKYYALSRYKDNPVYNEPKFEVVWLNYNMKKLNSENPEYIVISDYEYHYLANFKPGSEGAMFLDEVLTKDRYKEVVRFENCPHIFGIKFPKTKSLPADWVVTYPTILVLKRI